MPSLCDLQDDPQRQSLKGRCPLTCAFTRDEVMEYTWEIWAGDDVSQDGF